MIKRLVAENFRRHSSIDIAFEDDRQLILIAGRNGAGKSSILESVTMALYGEGRHGKKKLNDIVKRGYELEGMTVELEFTIGDDTYKVNRRRDGKSSTAVLYANDMPICEGPNQVTAEIEKLLGMDSMGFRLATIAQQKDIDGLASLRPADRVQMLTRLLRLDVITSAKEQAGQLFRSARDRSQALRSSVDIEEVRATLQKTTSELEAAKLELERAEEAVRKLDLEIAGQSDVADEYQQARQDIAKLEGEILVRGQEVERLTSDVNALGILSSGMKAPEPLEELAAEVSEVERQIGQGESAARTLEQRELVTKELSRSRAQKDTLESDLLRESSETIEAASARMQEARERVVKASGELDEAARKAAEAGSRVKEIQRRLERLNGITAVCDACGQPVTPEHKNKEEIKLNSQLTDEVAEAARLELSETTARDALSAVQDLFEDSRDQVGKAKASKERRENLVVQLEELDRRVGVLEGQLDRLAAEPVDMTALYARREELSDKAVELKAQHESWREWNESNRRRQNLAQQLVEANERYGIAQAELGMKSISGELEERFQGYTILKDTRKEEQKLLAYWSTESAVAFERRNQQELALSKAADLENRRKDEQQAAVNASAAAKLLGDVADQMTTRIRPALEGAVSALITTMSEGRFTKVEIDQDYNIKVHDDGEARELTNLSGGEIDLVALSVRLALAQVVGEQHGADGAGFLILDECFGSQDPERRLSIVNALRTLKGIYPQIFLISHVENMEDSADMLVEVTLSNDRSDTQVNVT